MNASPSPREQISTRQRATNSLLFIGSLYRLVCISIGKIPTVVSYRTIRHSCGHEQHSHRTAHRGSLPVNSSVPTSEAISISGDLVGASMVEKREEEEVPTLRVSCTCTDPAEGRATCGTKDEEDATMKREISSLSCEIMVCK